MKGLILFSICLIVVGCQTSSKNCNIDFEKSFKSVLKQKGKPSREQQINIYTGIRLYEYQNSLYKFIPSRDTIVISESVWKCDEEKLIIWHIKDSIVDFLHIDKSTKY